jgi:hypothetical protein
VLQWLVAVLPHMMVVHTADIFDGTVLACAGPLVGSSVCREWWACGPSE